MGEMTGKEAKFAVTVGLWAPIAAAKSGEGVGGEPPKEILLFPSPKWQLADMTLVVDEAARKAIVSEFRRRKIDIVIDYEHQTLKAPENGSAAPAAAWIKDLRADDQGVWGTKIQWTEKAASFIRNGEYRYFSPVALFDQESKRVMALESVALTNVPRTNDQTPLTARAAASLIEQFQRGREEGMKWFEILKAALGRAGSTAPAEVAADLKKVVAALEADGAQPAGADAKATLAATMGFGAGGEIPAEIFTMLGLEKGSPLAKVQASILTLKAPADKVEKSEYDKVVAKNTELQGQLDATTKTGELEKLIAANRAKLTPAREKFVREIAATNMESAKAIVAELSAVVGSNVAGSTPAAGTAGGEQEGAAVVIVGDDEARPAESQSAHVAANCRAIMREKSCSYEEANRIRKEREAAAA